MTHAQRIVFVSLVFCAAMPCFGAAPTSWTWVNPTPAGPVSEVIFAKNRFLAFGTGTEISTSTNGIDWTSTRMRAVDSQWIFEPVRFWGVSSVVSGNGMLAGSINSRFATSSNGLDWTLQSPYAIEIAAGKGRFVMVDNGGSLWYFTDEADLGIIGRPITTRCIAFGHGRFVAVGSYGKAAVSRDGVSWSAADVGASSELVSVAFSRGRFLAASEYGELFLSVNGRQWRKCGSVPSRYHPRIIAGSRGFHVSDGTELLDGMRQWRVTARGEVCDSPLPRGVTDLARGNGITIAVGTTLATSRNETEWVTRYSDFTDQAEIVGLAKDTNGYSLLLLNRRRWGTCGSEFYESRDGTNWLLRYGAHPYSEKNPTSLAYGAGRFVAAGEGGTISMLTDSESRSANLGITNDFHRVRFANDRFFAFGTGITLQSFDGVNWSSNNCPPGKWDDVAFGNGYYVMTFGSRFRTSTDGETWIDPNNGQCCGVAMLAYANGMFYGAWNEYLFTFPYPENSQVELVAIAQGPLRTIVTGAFGVLAYGDNGAAVWSSDGILFQNASGAPVESVNAAEVIDGQIYIAGSRGAILRGNP